MAYSAAFLITALNAWLVVQALRPTGALASLEGDRIVWGLAALFCGMSLVWITFFRCGLHPHTASPRKAESVIYRVVSDSTWFAADGTRPLL